MTVPDRVAKRGHVALHAYNPDRLTVTPVYLGSIAAVQSLSQSLGSPTAIRVKDPTRPGASIIVDETFTVPELGTVSLNEYMLPSAVSWIEDAYKQNCQSVWLNYIDTCGAPDDRSTFDSILVFDGLRLSSITLPQLNALDQTDESLQIQAEMTVRSWYRIFPHRFSEDADTQVFGPVVAVIISDEKSCGLCSPYSDGSQKIYALAGPITGSPGLSNNLVWTEDRGTWFSADIASMGGTSGGTALVAVGTNLVVLDATGNSVHIAPKATPQAANWSEVTTGFVATKTPQWAYAPSTNAVFIIANGGYIYKATDITSGVSTVEDGSNTTEDGNMIDGRGLSVIVAVHDNNTIQYSTNGAVTWSLVETTTPAAGLNGPEAGANITCVAVLSDYQWYVGTSTGKIWYTGDRGVNWSQRTLPNQGTIATINRIVFTPGKESHGYLVGTTSGGAGYVARTVTRGLEWYISGAISDVPTNIALNDVAVGDTDVAVLGGEKSASDGIIALASSIT